MNPQSKLIVMMMIIGTGSGLGAGCDHRPRVAAGRVIQQIDAAAPIARNAAAHLTLSSLPDSLAYGGSWTFSGAGDSPAVDELSSGPSIVRESVDERCFGPSREDNTEVVACPQAMLLTIAAE